MITPAAQRQHDRQVLEQEVAELKQELIDKEYAERLAGNSDFAKLCADYRAEMARRLCDHDEEKTRLVTQPLPPDAATHLREKVLLGERDKANMEDFLGYPKRVHALLKELRVELEMKTAALDKLKGEGDHG